MILIIILLIFALIILANIFCESLAHPKVRTYEMSYELMKQIGDIQIKKWLAEHITEDFEYCSEYGYKLLGKIYRNPFEFKDGKRRVVILSHGYTSNYIEMIKYGMLYCKFGFDIVMYDHRYHGLNDKNTFCSMSLYESEDLKSLYNYVKTLFPENSIWGLQGESMGSAVIMTAAPYMNNLSFLVEDCGFADMKQQMIDTMHLKKKLPSFPFVQIGEILIKAKYKFSYKDVRPIEHIRNVEIPVLFMHGDSDDFVPVENVYRLFNAKEKGYKEMHTFKGCLHAQSVAKYPEEYSRFLKEFLVKNKIIS